MASPRFFSRPGIKGRLESDFGDLLGGVEGGGAVTREGLERARGFDPSQAVSEFGGGFLDQASEQLGQSFGQLTGESTGAGRLRTGFMQRDQGRLFQDFNRRVANAIALQSMNAARLDLQNIQGMTGAGMDLMRQQTDVLGGAFDRATAEENARRGGGLGGLAARGAGFLAGSVVPGIGSVVGQELGGRIAGAFGDDDEEEDI